MRLHGFHDGRLYGTRYRTILQESSGETESFAPVGRLPVPDRGRAGFSYRLKTTRGWKSTLVRVLGRFPSVNVWPLTNSDLLATADNYVFVSRDGGKTWQVTRTLPDSSSPMGVLPTGVCQHAGTVYLGEYPLASSETPCILRSTDYGDTWDVMAELDDVRHIHAVQVDPYTDEIWVTTGDSESECQIGRVRNGGLDIVGSGGQEWRAVELVFTPDAVVWGVDSVYRHSNPILRLDRSAFSDTDPSPVSLYEASNSIYYTATLSVDSTQWIIVSTAMEAGTDSTGPEKQSTGRGDDCARVLAASSATDFEQWHELAAYEKRSVPVDWWNPRELVPIANAYVFLDTDSDRGLVINPHNTSRKDGSLIRYPLDYFTELESDLNQTPAQPRVRDSRDL